MDTSLVKLGEMVIGSASSRCKATEMYNEMALLRRPIKSAIDSAIISEPVTMAKRQRQGPDT